MPSSLLRIFGTTAKIRRLLRSTALEPVAVFWKGEPLNKRSDKVNALSSCNILLSNYDGKSLKTRIRIVSKVLRDNRQELLMMKAIGFKEAVVDFGIYDETPPGKMWPWYTIPPSFVQLLAEFGLGLKISFYGRRDDDLSWLESNDEPVDSEQLG